MSEPAEIDPFGAEWDRPRLTNRLTWVLVAAVVAALAFAGGLLIERQYDSTLLTTARSTTRPTGGGLAVAGSAGAAGRRPRGEPVRRRRRRLRWPQRPRVARQAPAAPAEALAAARRCRTGRAGRAALTAGGAPRPDGGAGAGAGRQRSRG